MGGEWILENKVNWRRRECEEYTETRCGAYNPSLGLLAKATVLEHKQPNTLQAREFLNKYKELYKRLEDFDHKNVAKVIALQKNHEDPSGKELEVI